MENYRSKLIKETGHSESTIKSFFNALRSRMEKLEIHSIDDIFKRYYEISTSAGRHRFAEEMAGMFHRNNFISLMKIIENEHITPKEPTGRKGEAIDLISKLLNNPEYQKECNEKRKKALQHYSESINETSVIIGSKLEVDEETKQAFKDFGQALEKLPRTLKLKIGFNEKLDQEIKINMGDLMVDKVKDHFGLKNSSL